MMRATGPSQVTRAPGAAAPRVSAATPQPAAQAQAPPTHMPGPPASNAAAARDHAGVGRGGAPAHALSAAHDNARRNHHSANDSSKHEHHRKPKLDLKLKFELQCDKCGACCRQL